MSTSNWNISIIPEQGLAGVSGRVPSQTAQYILLLNVPLIINFIHIPIATYGQFFIKLLLFWLHSADLMLSVSKLSTKYNDEKDF